MRTTYQSSTGYYDISCASCGRTAGQRLSREEAIQTAEEQDFRDIKNKTYCPECRELLRNGNQTPILPKFETHAYLNAYLPKDLIRSLKIQAAEEGTSASALIERALSKQ